MSVQSESRTGARPVEAVRTGLTSVSGRVQGAAGSAKGQAANLYGSARGKAQTAWSTAKQEVAANPFAAVAGAAAVGAGIGWLLPSGQRERAVLSGVAHKVSDVARDAANTAVEVGRQQVDDLTQNALASVGSAVVGAVVSGDQGRSEQ